MRNINLDQGWKFAPGMGGGMAAFARGEEMKTVNLPHDYMIETDVTPDAPAGPAMGYYTAQVAHYAKSVEIPAEWENEQVTLRFDGVMMNATVNVNGGKVALQHYGYAPFEVDITPYLYFGRENTINIVINPSMQPNSRWYSGAGMFRSVELVHKPKLHIANDGIFGYTREIAYREDGTPEMAFLQVQAEIVNQTLENTLARVDVYLTKDGETEVVKENSQVIQVNPMAGERAHLTLTVDEPELWDAEHPNLYQLHARVTDIGRFRTHRTDVENGTTDETSVLFGIRTVTADVRRGLRVNGKTVKLKGGCIHHDNGMLGAVSLYDSEYRKLSKLKEIGFNAVRTTHNPPSAVLMEAADRLGVYVFDEAFDAWGIGKQAGDYNMFFDTDWEKDLAAFMKRDRNHASVVIWSTGNEITERGGLNNGFTLAARLAEAARALDPSRPISNGICSMWSGLDDFLMAENAEKMKKRLSEDVTNIQNADVSGKQSLDWERQTEMFTNGLDIVGYNYMEDKYPIDHELYPERVMLGSENYPKEIGFRWPMVERTPYVLGDFTWTAFDYLGEAGIGKEIFVESDDPRVAMGPFGLMSHASEFPWRLANDADYDINGNLLAQGAYRSVVWGSGKTHLYSYDPAHFGKVELISSWGFPCVEKNWNWAGKEGKPVTVVVFSAQEEVELLVNGVSAGRVKVADVQKDDMPRCARFDITYQPGCLTAVSYQGGQEVSRDQLVTAGAPVAVRVKAEGSVLKADGHGVAYVQAEIIDAHGQVVPDAEIAMTARLEAAEGVARLAAFGSANPITQENYTRGSFASYRGRVMAVVRSGYVPGQAVLTIQAEGLGEDSVELAVE